MVTNNELDKLTIYEKCDHPECGRFCDGAGWSCRAVRDGACKAHHDQSDGLRDELARRSTSGSDAVLQLLNHIEDVVDDANWEKIRPDLWNAVTKQCAQQASGSDGTAADLATKLNAAVDAEYPIPDNPHASVVLRATDNRAAMWRGINAARKILAQPASGSDETQSVKVDERALFEVALARTGRSTARNAAGIYEFNQAAWEMWQARAALAQQAGAPVGYLLVPKKLPPEVVDAIASASYDLDDTAREIVREDWACSLAIITQHATAPAAAPAPAAEEVRIKTWQERCDWWSDRSSTKLMVEAMKAEIADLRAAMSASQGKTEEAK